MVKTSGKSQGLRAIAIVKSLEFLFSPIVRILIKRRIAFPLVAHVLQKTYIRQAQLLVAEQQPRQKGSVSAIALASGVKPTLVKRALEHEPDDSSSKSFIHQSPEVEIMEYWWEDPLFLDTKGKPRALKVYGKGRTFQSLVKRTQAGSLGYGVVLDTLLRAGAVELSSDGKEVMPLMRFYQPTNEVDESQFEILCRALGRLGMTLEHNINPDRPEGTPPFFQQEVWTRMVKPHQLASFREVARTMLDRYHKDTQQKFVGWEEEHYTQRRQPMVGIGFHYFEAKSYA